MIRSKFVPQSLNILWSLKSQTTVPEPPASASAVCRVGKSTVDMKKDENIDLFAATVTQEIILDLNWEVPESGN